MPSTPSPRFAIDAERLLREGRPLEALARCERGVEVFPEYPTGYLLLARARLAAGNVAAALDALRDGMVRMPHAPVFRALVTETEKRLSSSRRVEEETRTLEALAKTLEGATIPPAAGEVEQGELATQGDAPIVTPTLADIYAKQGLFDAAIKAYTTLAATHRSRKKEFERKIEELKARRAAQEPPGADR